MAELLFACSQMSAGKIDDLLKIWAASLTAHNDEPPFKDCDPYQLIHNLLQNPDFHAEFDYTPYQEYSMEGNHRFHNVMSGNWCWCEVVNLIN